MENAALGYRYSGRSNRSFLKRNLCSHNQRSRLCSELPKPLRMAPSTGFSRKHITTMRMMVVTSSITLILILSPLFSAFRRRGRSYFSALWRWAAVDQGKSDAENTLLPGGRLSASPVSATDLPTREPHPPLQERIWPVPGKVERWFFRVKRRKRR